MLADQLLDPAHDWDILADGMKAWKRVLARAEKFDIGRDLAEVIDAMPRKDVQAAMPFCRLPFPVCWIEVAHADRPAFMRVGVAPGHFSAVRVGILCEQDGDDPSKFWATLAWSYTTADTKAQRVKFGMDVPPLNVCAVGCYVDTTRPQHWPALGKYEAFDAAFYVEVMPAPYWLPLLDKMPLAGINTLKENADNDWQGELWFWLGALALVNARNGVESEHVPAPVRLNRARQKAGKPALVEYHQLTLRVGHRGRREPGESHAPGHMRAHTVRGHFKVRRTGIFWWQPFMRGDLAEGFTGKRYKVKL
jgi:hypothetical protein